MAGTFACFTFRSAAWTGVGPVVELCVAVQQILDAYEVARTAMPAAITYGDGASTLTLTAVPGSTVHEAETTTGVMVTSETRDFLILASELTLGPPERTHYIEEVLGGMLCRFEPMAVDGCSPSSRARSGRTRDVASTGKIWPRRVPTSRAM